MKTIMSSSRALEIQCPHCNATIEQRPSGTVYCCTAAELQATRTAVADVIHRLQQTLMWNPQLTPTIAASLVQCLTIAQQWSPRQKRHRRTKAEMQKIRKAEKWPENVQMDVPRRRGRPRKIAPQLSV